MNRVFWGLVFGAAIAYPQAGRGAEFQPVHYIPLSYQANLATQRTCSYRGPVWALKEANDLNANLVVAFVRSSDVWRMDWRTQENVRVKGKAMYCPPKALEQILQKYGNKEQRGGAS